MKPDWPAVGTSESLNKYHYISVSVSILLMTWIGFQITLIICFFLPNHETQKSLHHLHQQVQYRVMEKLSQPDALAKANWQVFHHFDVMVLVLVQSAMPQLVFD